MLQSIVGPPLTGPTDLKSPPKADKDFKGSSSKSSFGQELDTKISKTPKETKEDSRSEKAPLSDEKKSEVAKAAKEDSRRSKTGDVGKKNVQRQQAIQEFMDSIESEFQIPPTRLVEAMAELDDQQLAQAPEQSAQAFIAQLGLSEEDSEKAQALYAGLLTQLQQISTQPQPVSQMGLMAGSHSFTGMEARVAQHQEKQDLLNASLDKLSKSFWKTPEASFAESTPNTGLEGADQNQALQNALNQQSDQVDLKELPPHLQGQMKEVASPALLAALAAQKARSLAEESGVEGTPEQDLSQLKDEFKKTAELGPQSGSGKNGIAAMAQKNSSESADLFSQTGQNNLFANQNGMSGEAGATNFSEALEKLESSLGELKENVSGMDAGKVGPQGEALKSESVNSFIPVTTPPGTKGPSAAEEQAAVQQLMKEAKFLVNKGGGEMSVQMTPEGMGTVHLKVLLQDGKVNVQMQADNQEAKKAIESSLAELKTSLAAQKLSMDNVKVDVVGQTSADTATQNQTQSNGQGRDQTRQFWNQFNENFGSQGRRESLTEMPSLRGYGAKRDPLQAIDTASTTRSTRQVEGKGSGLNLVA